MKIRAKFKCFDFSKITTEESRKIQLINTDEVTDIENEDIIALPHGSIDIARIHPNIQHLFKPDKSYYIDFILIE